MTIMMLYRAVFENLLGIEPQKITLCCICLKIVNAGCHVDDEIQIIMQSGSPATKKLSAILESCLGETIRQVSSLFKTICNQCQEEAVTSYHFLNTCKETRKTLSKAIQKIDLFFKDVPNDINNFKTLYVAIDPNEIEHNSVIKRIYDKYFHSDKRSALQRINVIAGKQARVDSQHSDVGQKDTLDALKIQGKETMEEQNPTLVDIVIETEIERNVEAKLNEDKKFFNYRCMLCHAGFNDEKLYKRHLKKKRKCTTRGRGIFTCLDCGYKCPYKAQLQSHMLFKHLGKVLVCEECGKTCSSRSALKAHMESHTNAKNFECPDCNGKFKSAYSLKNHQTVHTGEKKYPCKSCGMKFCNASRRMEHVRRYHQIDPVKCDICEKVFNVKSDMKRHRKIHFTEPRSKYPCDQCSHRSYTKKQLEQHIAFRHRGEKPFVCELCGKGFGTEKLMKLHYTTVHIGKTFPCDKCGQVYKSAFGLKSHMNTHTGDKPYVCRVCGETFKDSNRRLEHMKRQHLQEEHKCEHCQKVYRMKQDLYRHIKRSHIGVSSRKKCVLEKSTTKE